MPATIPTPNQEALKILGELLVQIRGIAGDAVATGHTSAMGRGHFTPESACKAIYQLADAAHNIPEALACEGAAFLLNGAMRATACAGVDVFGDRSTLPIFMPSS